MFRYRWKKEKRYSPDIGLYRSFGIQVLKKAHRRWSVYKTVSDISTDRRLVRRLVRRCNIGVLDPVHLMDVIVDFLDA